MKTLKYTLLAALSIFVAASCTKESTEDVQQPSAGVDVKAVFEAVAEDDMSKALLQSNGGLQWESGDQIAVYQYGWYKLDESGSPVARDDSKNVFTSDGTCLFSGTIKNYSPLVESDIEKDAKGKVGYERYYAAYPSGRVICGSTTGYYTVTVPDTQTGLLGDFKEYAVYLGSLRKDGEALVEYNDDNQTLEFLKSFSMFCMTPVLKFNIPESLNVSNVVLSAKDASGNDVNIAGKLNKVRADAGGSQPQILTAATAITVENGGSVLSGDVYVVIAPDSNQSHSTINRRSQFKSSAKTLTLNLSTPQGATATLQLPLEGEILAGTIKNLPALPTSVNWNYPAGPGLSAIEINKTAITSTSGSTLNARTRILLTPENTESTITYRSRTSLSDLMGATIMNPYNSTNGILRSDADTPENYLEINVATEDYKDFTAYACVWILNNSYGFGKVMTEDSEKYTTITTETGDTKVYELNPETNSTYPTDGTYLYGLSFTYLTPPANTETKYRIPEIKEVGMYISSTSSSSTAAQYWSGNLNIKVPQTGTAKLFFDCYITKNTKRTITIKRGDESIDTVSTGDKDTNSHVYRVVSSDFFEVTADDVLKISIDKFVRFDSITLLWEPTVTEEALANESYSSKTSYGN